MGFLGKHRVSFDLGSRCELRNSGLMENHEGEDEEVSLTASVLVSRLAISCADSEWHDGE